MSKQKYDILILELIPLSKVGSGFEREDTRELPEDQKVRIIHPKNRVIMNTSIIRQKSTTDPNVFVNVVTRSIYGQEEIIKTKQEEAKMTTSIRDKIVFVNGLRIVPNDGAFVGEYKWAKNHAQNESNPERPLKADGSPLLQPVFREVKQEKVAHDKNVYDLQLAKAMGYINNNLVKEKAGGFDYNEEKVESVSSIFGVVADSPAQKVAALIAFAKAKPDVFMDMVKKGEQVVDIEIKHAVKLGVIAIDGAAVVFKKTGEVIKKYSNAQNSDESKYKALGNFYQKVEGKEAYELFKARLEEAKEAALA